ncbi:MAG: ABC transporter ATP-binding protein [Gammaproteobacteria bacterium]|nr:ABC transporter ATP-binding protein [Gammaproteobacteria bacterium]MCY4217904.1 ABC transporter ATP-binding protein [Gammaproteobacteria bacterium]
MQIFQPLYHWFEQFRTPFPEELPEKPPNTLHGFIAHYARPFWPLILVGSILSTVIALTEVYLFAFMGSLVDWLTTSDRTTFWETHSTKLILISLLIVVVLPLLKIIYESLLHQGILGNFAMRTRWEIHRYLLRQSVGFFQSDFAGRIAAKMMQTSLGVRDTVVNLTEVLLYIAVYFGGALILFAQSDLRLTLPLLLWVVSFVVILYVYLDRMRIASYEQAEARSMVTGRVVDSYTNISTVKMFAHANHEDRYAREGMEIFLVPVYEQMRLSSSLSITVTFLNATLIFSVGALSVWLWYIDAVSTGVIAFTIGLVLRIQGMSQWIMWEIWLLFENIGVVQDGIDTISKDILITNTPNSKELKITQGAIQFKDVSFNYGKNDDDIGVVECLNLDIQGREKIGIVGRSGAGKSTLVNLMLRFYDLKHGKISIDGQDISQVHQESLRQHIGMVTQDTSLLHRSVLENIRYGREETPFESVVIAAQRARAHQFILELEDIQGRKGYEAHVGERGVKLSGGQRQRIAIARVLLKDAPILVLDEATSALDSEVEAAIQESLYELMENKTVIAIAHRLSTIMQMDRLIIMDMGKIVEQGTHHELLTTNGLYSTLWKHQSGGFIAQSSA